MIYHAAVPADWERARRTGVYDMSTRGRTLADEGFIHAAYEWQVEGVVNRFYGDVDELVLLVIDVGRLTVAVRDESPIGATTADQFPHIYGPLPLHAVAGVRPWRRGADGRWHLGDAQPFRTG